MTLSFLLSKLKTRFMYSSLRVYKMYFAYFFCILCDKCILLFFNVIFYAFTHNIHIFLNFRFQSSNGKIFKNIK